MKYFVHSVPVFALALLLLVTKARADSEQRGQRERLGWPPEAGHIKDQDYRSLPMHHDQTALHWKIRDVVNALADEATRTADLADSLRNRPADREAIRMFSRHATEVAYDLSSIEGSDVELRHTLRRLLEDGDDARAALKRTEFSPPVSAEWHRALDTMARLRELIGRL